jgi:heme-degrading monooxygenase HmoA
MQKNNNDESKLIILFRMQTTDQAGEDYRSMNVELDKLVRQNPGFVEAKDFVADDGEKLTIVWWRDEESLLEWRNLMRHREAQNQGRLKWYQYYKIEIARLLRSTHFVRKG